MAGGPIYGLTNDQRLVAFDDAAPGTLVQDTPITGLQTGEAVVGFDIRPATGQLIAVAVDGTTGRLYVVDTSNGVARAIGAAPFSTTLPAGGTWSVDFNPTVDRIRLVHSSGASFRVNPNDGTLAGTDTNVAPAKPSAVAYDRSVAPAPTATTLFVIDDVANTLGRIGGVDGTPSPNGGVTSVVGALGVDPDADAVAFDIAPQGDALATMSVAGTTGLYTLDLATGAATLVGPVGAGTTAIRDIALPRPPLGAMLGLAAGNTLVTFDASAPGSVSTRAVTGLGAGETLVGFDVRPATGEVIGVTITGTSGRMYRIDPTTGAATALGAAPFTVDATGATTWSVDVNPTVDRIRLTNAAGDSYRLNPINGALAAADTDIAPAVPSAVAYDRSVATSTATTLYAIDDVAEQLVIIGGPDGTPSPNGGVTTVRGSLGVVTSSGEVGFDVSPVGEAVASLEVGGTTGLYALHLASGRAELLGAVGDGTLDLLDLAFLPSLPAGASQFVAVSPTRLLDTRDGLKPAAGSTTDLQITGTAGVPADATAVVLNTTGTEATDDGYVTFFPTGTTRPEVSNHNLVADQTRANLVVVKLGAGGKVSAFTQRGTHLVVDVVGYYAAPTSTSGRYTALAPARLIDTRPAAKVAPQGTVKVPVAGQGGVPATGASSVVVNIAATEADGPGYLTAYASGTARPATSNLNVERRNGTVSNLAIVPVGADGSITVFSQRGAHVVVDVLGWYGDATARGGYAGLYVPLAPARVVDTRSGVGAPMATLPIASSIDATVAGAGGVPASGAAAVVVNVTVTESLRDGYVSVYPTGQPSSAASATSSVNVDIAGQPTPNLAVARVGTGGRLTVYAQVGGHLVIDTSGWFTA
ncbi:MAG: DUF4394 domain-containing protein [Acidimicrobiales bacterium]